jgi:hypothetical protein
MRNLTKLMLICAVFLSACTTPRQPDPVINTVIQKVEVPVYVPCNITIPEVPAFGFGSLKESDSIYLKVQILLSDRELHLGYEHLLSTALKLCTDK